MGPVCGVWGLEFFSRKIPIGVCGVGTLFFPTKNPYGGVGDSFPLSLPLRVGLSGMAVKKTLFYMHSDVM